MGWYSEIVFPFLIDIAMRSEKFAPMRRELLASAAGHVVEIGAGGGANFKHYPDRVEKITAVEPSRAVQARGERNKVKTIPVTWVSASAESLPLESKSADCVVSAFTLCSVVDPIQALKEVRRVLRPGGEFLCLEHGLAPDPNVQQWQRRLTPLQKKLACGCHFDRDISKLLRDQGWAARRVRSFFASKIRFGSYMTLGAFTV